MITGRDFLALADFSPQEITYLIDLAIRFKRGKVNTKKLARIRGRTAALIFEKPSTRTRVSMEVACHHLGIAPMYIEAGTTQLARGEPLEDFARVLDRYVDIIAARVYSHSTLETLAKYAKAPVINALSDLEHPLQGLADLMTIKEHFGDFSNLIVAFVGDVDNNVAHSLSIGVLKLGMEMRLVGPREYWPKKEFKEILDRLAKEHNAKLLITDDPKEGLRDANVIYTDVWVSMGQEAEKEQRLKVFRPYQVNFELVKVAHPDFKFMHCLPRHRGEEVSDDLFESKHSIVFDQAENRLHTTKAVFASVLTSEKL
ncbi:MAG: ornithine carbamoyltransferase [Crenarchaeota archaeon]|nr:ornithine carbamoyltransferase [Thermoproteota archaeon]MCR8454987.1 ornithine carbamoyltransferase [Thermoproteota archaeon]MCR8500942.1 ornithine carbamoyltransferase [Thermoproteota archaeon]